MGSSKSPFGDGMFSESVFRNFSDPASSSSGPRKAPPIENKLPCSLEELYTGSTRKMKISRNIVDASGYVSALGS
jgi:DnaJ family protein B protein 4